MIDIEKLKKEQAEKLHEAEVSNQVESEMGVSPTVYTYQGKLHINFHVQSDEVAGKILDRYEATTMMQTYKKRNVWHKVEVYGGAGSKDIELNISWQRGEIEYSIKLEKAQNSCVYGQFMFWKGYRKTTDIEAESAYMVKKNGRITYGQDVPRYVFSGENTEFQGGHVQSEEPTICDAVCSALTEKYLNAE